MLRAVVYTLAVLQVLLALGAMLFGGVIVASVTLLSGSDSSAEEYSPGQDLIGVLCYGVAPIILGLVGLAATILAIRAVSWFRPLCGLVSVPFWAFSLAVGGGMAMISVNPPSGMQIAIVGGIPALIGLVLTLLSLGAHRFFVPRPAMLHTEPWKEPAAS